MQNQQDPRVILVPLKSALIAGHAHKVTELARQKDEVRFAKEAVFSSRRMNTRLSAKEEPKSLASEVAAPSIPAPHGGTGYNAVQEEAGGRQVAASRSGQALMPGAVGECQESVWVDRGLAEMNQSQARSKTV